MAQQREVFMDSTVTIQLKTLRCVTQFDHIAAANTSARPKSFYLPVGVGA